MLPIEDSQPGIYHLFFVQVSAGVGRLPKKVVRFVADLSRPLADFVHSAAFPGNARGILSLGQLARFAWATPLDFASGTLTPYNCNFGLWVRGLAVGWQMS